MALRPWRLRQITPPPRLGGRPQYLDGVSATAGHASPGDLPGALPTKGATLSDGPVELALATHSVRWDGGLELWRSELTDPEDLSALHRFAFLPMRLVALQRDHAEAASVWQWLTRLVDTWVSAIGHAPGDHEAWHPYTISERLVNCWLVALACRQELCGWKHAPVIERDARLLVERLEYFGDDFTGNHLSNNGRALYVTGLALVQKDLAAIGREILRRERHRLFAEERFLREGSSHYQFLVTRNYVEALWCARRAGDRAFAEELAEVVSALLEGCRFFCVRDADSGRLDIPLIGDISPDCPPHWLLGVPAVAAGMVGKSAPEGTPPHDGWHCLFGDGDVPTTALPDGCDVGLEWARLAHGPWLVFMHANPAGHPIVAGHAHQDTGGVVIFHRGKPLLLDCGRKTYAPGSDGDRGREAWAHSMALVDGANPAPFFRRLYPSDFLRRRCGELPRFSIDAGSLKLTHGGYRRLPGIGIYERSLSAGKGALAITDSIDGSGKHHVKLLFHTPLLVERMADGCVRFTGDGRTFHLTPPGGLEVSEVRHGRDAERRLGWASKRYGEETAVTSVVLGGTVELPWRGSTRFEEI